MFLPLGRLVLADDLQPLVVTFLLSLSLSCQVAFYAFSLSDLIGYNDFSRNNMNPNSQVMGPDPLPDYWDSYYYERNHYNQLDRIERRHKKRLDKIEKEIAEMSQPVVEDHRPIQDDHGRLVLADDLQPLVVTFLLSLSLSCQVAFYAFSLSDLIGYNDFSRNNMNPNSQVMGPDPLPDYWDSYYYERNHYNQLDRIERRHKKRLDKIEKEIAEMSQPVVEDHRPIQDDQEVRTKRK